MYGNGGMRNGGKGLRICIDSMNTSLFSDEGSILMGESEVEGGRDMEGMGKREERGRGKKR